MGRELSWAGGLADPIAVSLAGVATPTACSTSTAAPFCGQGQLRPAEREPRMRTELIQTSSGLPGLGEPAVAFLSQSGGSRGVTRFPVREAPWRYP
jgi:hypothetical protein